MTDTNTEDLQIGDTSYSVGKKYRLVNPFKEEGTDWQAKTGKVQITSIRDPYHILVYCTKDRNYFVVPFYKLLPDTRRKVKINFSLDNPLESLKKDIYYFGNFENPEIFNLYFLTPEGNLHDLITWNIVENYYKDQHCLYKAPYQYVTESKLGKRNFVFDVEHGLHYEDEYKGCFPGTTIEIEDIYKDKTNITHIKGYSSFTKKGFSRFLDFNKNLLNDKEKEELNIFFSYTYTNKSMVINTENGTKITIACSLAKYSLDMVCNSGTAPISYYKLQGVTIAVFIFPNTVLIPISIVDKNEENSLILIKDIFIWITKQQSYTEKNICRLYDKEIRKTIALKERNIRIPDGIQAYFKNIKLPSNISDDIENHRFDLLNKNAKAIRTSLENIKANKYVTSWRSTSTGIKVDTREIPLTLINKEGLEPITHIDDTDTEINEADHKKIVKDFKTSILRGIRDSADNSNKKIHDYVNSYSIKDINTNTRIGGPYTIAIHLDDNMKIEVKSCNEHLSMWGWSCHPHINTKGRACYGNIVNSLEYSYSLGQYECLIDLIIMFLSKANLEDVAGKRFFFWPEA